MKKALLISVVICLVISSARCCAAERVVVTVVFSSNIEAFKQARDGFKEFFGEREISLWLSEHNLKEEENGEICSRINEEEPDIVITLGTKALKLIKERIKDIPVVFCIVLDPTKIINSNIAGVTMEIPERLKLLRPKLSDFRLEFKASFKRCDKLTVTGIKTCNAL